MNVRFARIALVTAHGFVLAKIADWAAMREAVLYPRFWLALCALLAAIGLHLAYRSIHEPESEEPWNERISRGLLGFVLGVWLMWLAVRAGFRLPDINLPLHL